MLNLKKVEPEPWHAPQADGALVSIRGFTTDWKSGNFQFEPGRSYEIGGEIEAYYNGFHAVQGHPSAVLVHWNPSWSRYAVVRQSGQLSSPDHSGHREVWSARITVEAELSLADLTQRASEWVWSRANLESTTNTIDEHGVASATDPHGAATASGDHGAAITTGSLGFARATGDYSAATAAGISGAANATGDYGAASATGDSGAAIASGFQAVAVATGEHGMAGATGDEGAAIVTGPKGVAAATGDRGAASVIGAFGAAAATGCKGMASAIGDCCAASATGEHGTAMASGWRGKVMGKDGCALFLVRRDNDSKITHTWSGIVGRNGVKADVWYTLDDNGKLVEPAHGAGWPPVINVGKAGGDGVSI
jgi:hypothetical protein